MAVLNFIQQVLSTPAIFVGLLALLGLAPVSYTHLYIHLYHCDYLNVIASYIQLLSASSSFFTNVSLRAVSYTHLDVYKRQVTGRGDEVLRTK